MERRLWRWIALSLFVTTSLAHAEDPRWPQLERNIERKHPRSAIIVLRSVLNDALERKDHVEATRALATRIATEAALEENHLLRRVELLDEALPQMPDEMHPVLHALSAQWMWTYFNQNRYRFQARTSGGATGDTTADTWDLPRILRDIDGRFQRALSNERQLQRIAIGEWREFLGGDPALDAVRPTLFDFLAHEAIAFYAAGEHGAIAPEDAFRINVDDPVFDSRESFVRWQPQVVEGWQPTLSGVKAYQALLEFHSEDNDSTALLEVDLDRLKFVFNAIGGEWKTKAFKEALDQFAERESGHPVVARAWALLAKQLYVEKDLSAAHAIATRAVEQFPQSHGASQAQSIMQQIEAKNLRIVVEHVWNDPLPSIKVHHSNLDSVHFRLYPDTAELDELWKGRWRKYDWNDLEQVLEGEPALAWSHALPPTPDFKQRTDSMIVPDGLESGPYLLVASTNGDFGFDENQVSWTQIWVSDLALVVRDSQRGWVEGLVVWAKSGKPVRDALIRYEHQETRGSTRQGKVRSDRNGVFRIYGSRHLYLVARKGRHRLGWFESMQVHRKVKPSVTTTFFTDRAIYRPGQTIYYKGIHHFMDRENDVYEVRKNVPVTVTFYDNNGKVVAQREHRTNDYGSFNGMFTAPRDRLPGNMKITDGRGRAHIQVEEYKRPSFRVTLEQPTTAALGGRVSVGGKAETFSGAPVSDALVRWSVTREVYSRYWRYRFDRSRSTRQVAHGVARTDAEGRFEVVFDAETQHFDKAHNPLFTFKVKADVTDGTGETRDEAIRIPLAFTSLQAGVHVEGWQVTSDSVQIDVTTPTPAGKAVAAPGRVHVYELQQPTSVSRPETVKRSTQIDHRGWRRQPPPAAGPQSWPNGAQVLSDSFSTNDNGRFHLRQSLRAGAYRVVASLEDASGEEITVQNEFFVLDPEARKFGVRIPHLLQARSMTVEPGGEFEAIWGTGYPEGRAWVQIEHDDEVLQAFWTPKNRTQHRIRQEIEESMRGGLILRVIYVRENRAYVEERVIDVPWTNKRLQLTWERFESKLEPGRAETWVARLRDHEGAAAVAEVVASLYDVSLDEIEPHRWRPPFPRLRRVQMRSRANFVNRTIAFRPVLNNWSRPVAEPARKLPAFPSKLIGSHAFGRRSFGITHGAHALTVTGDPALTDVNMPPSVGISQVAPAAPPAEPELADIRARRDLRETAFFFPDLRSDADGSLRIEFRMPETLTEWRLMTFAHDAAMRTGTWEAQAFTSKDFMVEPNPPRFVREGDVIELTAKVSNRSNQRLRGQVRLKVRDARTGDAVDSTVGNLKPDLSFDLAAGTSQDVAWRLHIPDGSGFLTYRVVGAADSLSDGEEGYLPVLSRRILVTESLPLPIRGNQVRKYSFDKLRKSKSSKTLQHQSLTLQMTSHPAWYAVMSLPYLMGAPYNCSDSIFYRLYANSLAFHIAHSDPKIRDVFDLWRDTPALDSPLEKNEEIKAVVLEETPWVRQAIAGSEARRNVGVLFDVNRLTHQTGNQQVRLQQMQMPSGLWPWFAGGRGSESVTLRIVSGFGRLRHMGVDIDVTAAKRALRALDKRMHEKYLIREQKGLLGDNNLGPTVALYLYGRSFFLEDVAIQRNHEEAIEYWQKQGRLHWPDLAGRQSQAHVALGLMRFGDEDTPEEIVRSFEERSVRDEEMGMHWRDASQTWWWYRAPIETQAMMIEAFREITSDSEAVEECQVWLLKQKQTQDWKTTRATADAVYALLLGGSNLLGSDELVQVSLGGEEVKPQDVEAGTGYYEQRFVRNEVQAQMGDIQLTKVDDGVSWGSMHWQYLEDISKITPSRDNPLRIEKRLFTKVTTKKGEELRPVKGPVQVGDELVVRLVLRTDRDLEYVHLKDQRGSGTEPALSVSRYRWQDGLGYYETTRDTASHFFIDYMRRGTYVFEYSTWVQLRGEYQSGMAQVQCMYAPEFNSHSESFGLVVE